MGLGSESVKKKTRRRRIVEKSNERERERRRRRNEEIEKNTMVVFICVLKIKWKKGKVVCVRGIEPLTWKWQNLKGGVREKAPNPKIKSLSAKLNLIYLYTQTPTLLSSTVWLAYPKENASFSYLSNISNKIFS